MKWSPGSKVKVRELDVTSELLLSPRGTAEIALTSLAVQLLAVYVLTLLPEPCAFLLDPPWQVIIQQSCAAKNAH